MWKKIVLALLTGFLSTLFSSKKNKSKEIADESLESPKVEEGGVIPVVFGTVDIKSPMVAWYGDVKKEAAQQGGNTVAYRHSLGMHLILCLGNCDNLIRARVDEKEVYLSDVQEANPGLVLIVPHLEFENLFGGLSEEGGINGVMAFYQGFPNQAISNYLEEHVEGSTPAYRGVTSVTLVDMYIGTTAYLKKWDFRVQRIFNRYYGLPQWYDTKAAIETIPATQLIDPVGEFKHAKVLGSDPYGWETGNGAFGNLYSSGYSPEYPINTVWDGAGRWWVKILVEGDDQSPLFISGVVEHLCKIYIIKGDYYSTDEPPIPLFESGWAEIFSHDYDDESLESQSFLPYSVVVSAQTLGSGFSTIFAQVDSESDGFTASYFYMKADLIPQYNMNPAHIVRECLTDLDWGLGYREGDINEESFKLAADTLYNEGLGISLLWDRQSSLEEFVNEILRHASAELYVDRTTGKFVIKLIRDDYNPESLLVFNQSNVIRLINYKKKAFGELINSVAVNYQDLRSAKRGSINIRDGALIQTQDGLIQKKIEYQGITNPQIATDVGRRDLKVLSSPLLSCTLYAYKEAESLNQGDVFKLNYPDYDINDLIMRVNSLTLGNGEKKEVKIDCTEDVFATPVNSLSIENPIEWEEPSNAPINTYKRVILETPYRLLVDILGQLTIDYKLTVDNGFALLGVTGGKPTGTALNFDLWVEREAAGFNFKKTVDFCPFADLRVDSAELDTSILIKNQTSIDFLESGTFLLIDSEIMKLVSINETGTVITVERGMLDTVVTTHDENAYILFFDNYLQLNPTEYTDGLTIGSRFLTTESSGQLSLNSAFTTEIEMDGRAFRPYPPGNFKINGEYFPDLIAGQLALTWAYRDRLSSTLVDFTNGDVVTEVGVTYNIRLYDEYDLLMVTETGITDNFYNCTTEQGITDDYQANVQLLLYFEGVDGSTDFVDTKDNYILTPQSNAEISTDQFKIRTSSMYLDGGSSLTTDDFVIPAVGDFTIDLYFYRITGGGNDSQSIVSQYNYNSLVDGRLLFGTKDDKIQLVIGGAGGINFESTETFTFNTWNHLALVRDTTTVRVYLNGIQINSEPSTQPIYESPDTCFGNINYSLANSFFYGYLDYVRYTNAVRYQEGETFTPPDIEYELRPSLRVEIESERDGYVSSDKYNVSIERTGYGLRYGQYYGGK